MKVLPEQFSSFAGDIDWLIMTITYFVVGWFIVALGAMMYGIFANLKTEGGKAKYIPGIGWEQTKWILIPLILVVMCDFYIDIATSKVWSKVEYEAKRPQDGRPVKVVASQFTWEFFYSGADKKWGTDDDFSPSKYGMADDTKPLILPVGEDTILHLTAMDVLHCFYVRQFRFKQDVIPGRQIVRWVNPNKEGTYELICAEICGPNHGAMRGEVKVVSQEEYKRFLSDPKSYLESLPDIKAKPAF